MPEMPEASTHTESLSCTRCGLIVGHMVVVEEETLLQVGGLIVREISGVCAKCGTGFYYSLNARRLERLIRRVISNHEKGIN